MPIRKCVWAGAPTPSRPRARARTIRRITPPCSFQLEPDHSNDAVRNRPIALQPRSVRDQVLRMVEVEDPALVEEAFGALPVDRLARLELGRGARLLVPAVELLVAILAHVL